MPGQNKNNLILFRFLKTFRNFVIGHRNDNSFFFKRAQIFFRTFTNYILDFFSFLVRNAELELLVNYY